MKKTKLTRSLLAACSIVALTAVMYGCVHDGDDGPALSELDVTGIDTADGADVMSGSYSVDDVPAALLSAVIGHTGPISGATGDELVIGGYTFTCEAGPCSVTVSDDEEHFTVVGTINVAKMMTPVTPPEPTGPTVADLFATAQTARDAADDASDAAVQAVKDATKYSTMYTAQAVHGDSTIATANAQKVLDAKAAADKAVADAMAAKMAAEGAKTAAGNIAADDPQRTPLIAAIDAAIEAADEALKAAENNAKDTSLLAAYEAVLVNTKKPKTADYHGKQVAMTIGAALGPTSDTDGSALRHTHAAGDAAAPTIDAAVMASHVSMNDAQGKTFAQIVGADNVMSKPAWRRQHERVGGCHRRQDPGQGLGYRASRYHRT